MSDAEIERLAPRETPEPQDPFHAQLSEKFPFLAALDRLCEKCRPLIAAVDRDQFAEERRRIGHEVVAAFRQRQEEGDMRHAEGKI